MVYLERFGAFGEAPRGHRLGFLSWGLAQVLQAAWSGERESAADYASLLLVAQEQVSLDQGQWQVGW
eukprot:10653819-Alexandrium_andersonii.AAC.1